MEEELWKFFNLGSLLPVYRPGYRQIEDSDADVIRRLIDNGRSEELIKFIGKASKKCLKFYPVAYALALCARHKKTNVSNLAYAALSEVCSIPSHLFQFLSFCRTRFKCRGWPRSHRKAVAAWYTENKQYRKDPKRLAIHVTKYKKRHMFSQKKVIKSCHPKPPNDTFKYIFRYVTNGMRKANTLDSNEKDFQNIKGYITTVENIKGKNTTEEEIIQAIQKWRIPWENIPTSRLQSPEIWRALLKQKMPMTAMIRNLGRMGRLGILETKSDEERIVCERLRNVDSLESTHPIQLLAAFAAYRRGRGLRDSGHTWDVNTEIERALLASYHRSAKQFESTSSKVLIAIDVNMNMDYHVLGIPSMSCKEAAIALSLLLHDTFSVEAITFYKTVKPISLDNPSGELFDTDFSENHCDRGETNYDVPFKFAQNKFNILLFLTDTLETRNIDKIRRSYRKTRKKDSKCVIVCLKSSRPASEAGDSSMLDVVGVDEYGIEVIKDFIKGYTREMRDIIGGRSHEMMEVENQF